MLSIGQIHGAIIANILHNVRMAIFQRIATAWLLIHGHHLAPIFDAADNPAIRVKIGRIHGGNEPFLRGKLRHTPTSIISASCAKGQQLIFGIRLYADHISLDLPSIHFVLQIGIGHALS